MKVLKGYSSSNSSCSKFNKANISTLLKPSLIAFAVAQTMSMSSAQAATIEVNTNTDDGRMCTLRKAVLSVNESLLRPGCSNTGDALGVDDTIIFADTLAYDSINLLKGPLRINGGTSVLIDASSVERVTIDASNSTSNNYGGVFSVTGASELSIENLTITGGSATQGGGGISARYSSTVYIENSSIHANQAHEGGGIFLAANSNARVYNSSLTNNIAIVENTNTAYDAGGGGGIKLDDSFLIMQNSSVSGNQAPLSVGGGISVANSYALIGQTTIADNYAFSGAGLAINDANFSSTLNTISGNSAASKGGGISFTNMSNSRYVGVFDTTIADNDNGNSFLNPSDAIYADSFQSSSIKSRNSIFSGQCRSGSSATFSDTDSTNISISINCGGNSTIANPKLLPLADNGCATKHATPTGQACVLTHALVFGSPAIDTSTRIGGTDQIGTQRPQGPASDVGAYERPILAMPGFAVTATQAREGEDYEITFTITLDEPQPIEVAYDFITQGGSATDGIDYQGRFGRIIFPAGVTQAKRRVTIYDDGISSNEGDEFFYFIVGDRTNPSASISTEGVIRDSDDFKPRISIEPGSRSVSEGADNASVRYTIKMSEAQDEKVSVDYQTMDQSAIAGEDYAARSGTMTFAPGQTTKIRLIKVLADNDAEADETFKLVLSNSSDNALLEFNDADSIGTILDDDSITVPVISIVPAAHSFQEFDSGIAGIRFDINMTPAQIEQVTFDFQTMDLTATGGIDYQVESRTITFAPGQTNKIVKPIIFGDTEIEGDETFKIVLSNPSGNAVIDVDDADSIGTILDDD